MSRFAFFLATLLFLGNMAPARAQDKLPAPRKTVPDGIYAVQRDGLKEKELQPLKDTEIMVINHHRYVKKGDDEPPRNVVVRSIPDVTLDLASEPKSVKEGEEVVRILLKLKPKAASALEQLTRDQREKQIAIVLDGEVITMHKIREVIKGGEVQITSCTAGAAGYLMKQLEGYYKKK